MDKNRHSLVTMGISSIFLIFAVLCTVVLALLTLASARSDLNMSTRSMEQTAAYYDACTKASDLCVQAEDALYQAFLNASAPVSYFASAKSLLPSEFSWNEEERTLTADIAISDSQSLHIELEALYPQSAEDPLLDIHIWQTISTGSWNPDTRQPVYQKENIS